MVVKKDHQKTYCRHTGETVLYGIDGRKFVYRKKKQNTSLQDIMDKKINVSRGSEPNICPILTCGWVTVKYYNISIFALLKLLHGPYNIVLLMDMVKVLRFEPCLSDHLALLLWSHHLPR